MKVMIANEFLCSFREILFVLQLFRYQNLRTSEKFVDRNKKCDMISSAIHQRIKAIQPDEITIWDKKRGIFFCFLRGAKMVIFGKHKTSQNNKYPPRRFQRPRHRFLFSIFNPRRRRRPAFTAA